MHSYNEKWPFLFKEEAEKLKLLFGSEIVEIHHIGSTAVPGLKAKPIIDMLPVVKNIELVDSYNEEMKKFGYEPKGENGLPGRRYFKKGGDNRSHHVHIYQIGHPDITRHLAFRDYLREHPVEKEQYGALKTTLAKQFPYDIDSYIKGKDSLVKDIETKALKWWEAKRFPNKK